MPILSSITFYGLLYGYYFDTKTIKNARKQSEISDEGSNLFYPWYSYAKIQKLAFINSEKNEVKKSVNCEPFDTINIWVWVQKKAFEFNHLLRCFGFDE